MSDVTSFYAVSFAPGYVVSERVKCGKPNCKCQRGELHGPYYYRRGHSNGVHWKKYVRRGDVERVKAQCEAYRQMRRDLAASRRRYRDLMEAIRARRL